MAFIQNIPFRRLACAVLMFSTTSRNILVQGVSGGEKEVQLGERLKEHFADLVPRVIVDVGANRGDWSRGMRSLYPSSKLLLLEATEKHATSLSETINELGNAKFEIAVLSEEAGTKVKFYQGNDTGNSMFRENTRFYENDVPVDRITTTVDIEIEKHIHSSFITSFEEIDYLKLDIQGAELLALKGATKVLEHATFVQFEASLIEYNENGACFSEIDQLLRDHGFVWYDMGDIARDESLFVSPGAGQFDVVYVKPSSPKLPERLREAKFCGYQRMVARAVPPITRGGAIPITSHTASTFDVFDEQLIAALAKEHRRPWAFFALGFVLATLSMSVVLVVLKIVPSRKSCVQEYKAL